MRVGIVEVAGSQHSGQQICDSERDAWLKSQDIECSGFWNNLPLSDIEAVKEAILAILEDG